MNPIRDMLVIGLLVILLIQCNTSNSNQDASDEGSTASYGMTGTNPANQGSILINSTVPLEQRIPFDKLDASTRQAALKLVDKKDNTALRAIQDLVHFPNKKTLPVLHEILKTDIHYWENGEIIFSNAIEAVGYISDSTSVPLLVHLLQFHASSYIRSKVAQVLGSMRYPEAIPPLKDACDHPDFLVRWRAAEALGKFGDTRVTGPLLFLLEDTNPNVRKAAVESLGQMNNLQSIQPMLNTLSNDTDASVRKSAALSLGKLQVQEAIPVLYNLVTQSNDLDIRIAAAQSLSLYDLTITKDFLLKGYVANAHPSVRKACVLGLSHYKKEELTTLLIRMLESETDPEVIETIQWVLDSAQKSSPDSSSVAATDSTTATISATTATITAPFTDASATTLVTSGSIGELPTNQTSKPTYGSDGKGNPTVSTIPISPISTNGTQEVSSATGSHVSASPNPGDSKASAAVPGSNPSVVPSKTLQPEQAIQKETDRLKNDVHARIEDIRKQIPKPRQTP